MVSHGICSTSHLCFFLVWRICSMPCLLDQLALSTAVNTKSCKQMVKFNFQLGKGSIATSEWNICLVTFTRPGLLQTKHTHKCALEGAFKYVLLVYSLKIFSLFPWRFFSLYFRNIEYVCTNQVKWFLTSFSKVRLASQVALEKCFPDISVRRN